MIMTNKNESYNIYICGVGGQGIIKTSVVLGEAAMDEGYEVVLSEIHGMSQRGGVVSTELKIGGYKSTVIEESKADVLLAFEPIEAIRGLNKANKNTNIVFNTHPIKPSTLHQTNQEYPDTARIIATLKDNYKHVFPIEGEKLAKDAGNLLSLNMVLLGSVIANDTFTKYKKAVINSMKSNFKDSFHDVNLKAFENGYDAVKNSIN
jgi:indolepyruvate ferredoxin oxidoreductase beta subunit